MSTNEPIKDDFLDEAASDAIGAGTAAESAGFAKRLDGASPEEKKAARHLRETVARMAGASPFMEPPAGLRGRILQATAPATFKMSDYKKAAHPDARWWRFASIAAVLFLVAAAYWNLSIQNAMKGKDAQIAQLNQQLQNQATAIKKQNAVITMALNPKVDRISLQNKEGVNTGLAFVDKDAKSALLILPGGVVPTDKMPVVSVDNVAYNTFTLIQGMENAAEPTEKQSFAIGNIHPDNTAKAGTIFH